VFISCKIAAEELDLAARRRVKTHQQARHRALAAAGLADQRQRLAAVDLEAHAVDGAQDRAPLLLQYAVEPGRRDVEELGDVSRLDDRLAGGRGSSHGLHYGAHAAARPAAASCSQQAASALPAGNRSGRSRRQRSNTRGQRGLNAQPAGIAVSRGMLPSICVSRSASPTMLGIEPISPGRVRVLRAMDHVGHRTDLGDAAGVHHRHAVGGLGDHAHVVRHQHHRGLVLAAQRLDEADDLRLDRYIQRGGGLVGDHELRLGGQRQRDHHALPHAAGKLVRIVVDAPVGRGNASGCQQIDRALARRRLRHVQVRGDRLDELLADRVQRVERGQRILEDRADLAPADLAHVVVRQVVDAQPVELDLAGGDAAGRLEQADDRRPREALACARLAHHTEHLARRDRERHVVDRQQRATARRELDAQVLDFQQRATAHRRLNPFSACSRRAALRS
jgi:hypothetical protein